MGAGPCQEQDKLIIPDLIDKKPIGVDVAFAKSRVTSAQRMVSVFCLQRFAGCKPIDNVRKTVKLIASFLCELQVFFELN